jgi:hypothetical protein
MQHRPVLRDVDPVPVKHRFDAVSQAAFGCKLHQQSERFFRNTILGVIEV